MTTTALGGRALWMALAIAFLAGCGGTQKLAPGAPPMSSANAVQAKASNTAGDLVYATGGCGGVCVFRYPDGALKAKITVTGLAEGDCSDGAGNVFVTNDSQILEYAHGGTSPIAMLPLPGTEANSCAVDPMTGNLAICGFNQNSTGNVAIYADATGTPKVYDAGQGASHCGYDNEGNLFVDGRLSQDSALAELPYGTSAFMPLILNGDPGAPGQVQWDGAFITWENTGKDNVRISRLSISGTAATIVGQTRFKGPKWAGLSWISGNRVILPYSTTGSYTNKIGLWRYPKNGKVVAKFPSFGQSKTTTIVAATLSIKP